MQKKTARPLLFAIIYLFLFMGIGVKNLYAKERAGVVLTPAYSFFSNLKNHNFKKLWNLLTLNSKQYITDNIENSFKKHHVKIGKNKIYQNMSKGGYIAKAYWTGFLKTFKPNMVLKYSVWKIKSIGSKSAKIEIDYKYGKAPTIFDMYKQNGKWKFGLIESLYGRILMKKITHAVINKF